MNIAIDGPAGAGKSTIAKRLAAALGFVYLDTGAMYRAVALHMLRLQIPAAEEKRVAEALATAEVRISYEDGAQKVWLSGEDVSAAIREHAVSGAASAYSALPCVRAALLQLQRDMAANGDVILDGRDIGTFVLPHAEVKFYLTASVEERARRRFAELRAKGAQTSLEVVKKDIADRDYQDMHRAVSPLKKADDAIEVDTTGLSIEQVAEKMLAVVKDKRA